LELLSGIRGTGGVGIVNVGCFMIFAGGGGCCMTGIFGEWGAAGAPVILTLFAGIGVRELMKNRIKSAPTGMTMMSTNTITPSRVKRK